MSRIVRLYPRVWRERYLAELEELLSDRPPTLRDRLDLVRGAFDAWIHPQLVARLRPAEAGTAGVAGVLAAGGAIIGGGLWIAAGLATSTAAYLPGYGYKDAGLGVALIVGGMVVTALAAIATARSLDVGSRNAGVVASAMLVAAALTAFPWPVLIIGFFGYILATAAFGAILARSPGRIVGGVLAIAALILPTFNTEDERALIAIPFGLAWVAVGTLALRRSPVATAA